MTNADAGQLLPRQEWWRRQYVADRYMRGLSDEELDHRFADIFSNTTILTQEGKHGIGNIEWMEKFTHVMEELTFRRRGFPPHDTIKERFAIPKPSMPALGPMIREKYPNGIPSEFTLFKYGKRKYLQPLLEAGTLRLAPASSYADPSLNVAVGDRELEFEKIVGHERFRYLSENFYCYCTAWLHSDRLIHDFEADSVLAIKNPREFFTRIATALDERDYTIYVNRVTYVDPLLMGQANHITDLAMVKHLRFAYQFEHRFVAKPPSPRPLDTRFLTLGPLADIAELFVAPDQDLDEDWS
jgi:hypothetical protein